MRKFLTILSDHGDGDYYTTFLLGKLYSTVSDVVVVVQKVKNKFDVRSAGFMLSQYYDAYPAESLHICLINDLNPYHQRMLIFQYQHSYVCCYDNGIVSTIRENPQKIWSVYSGNEIFPLYKTADLISKVTLAWKNNQFDHDFIPVEEMQERILLKPLLEKNLIIGHVIYVDDYGNCITNIHIDDFSKYAHFDHYIIFVSKYEIKTIVRDYVEASLAELIALFGSHGYLELAIVGGNARELIGVDVSTTIRIEFY